MQFEDVRNLDMKEVWLINVATAKLYSGKILALFRQNGDMIRNRVRFQDHIVTNPKKVILLSNQPFPYKFDKKLFSVIEDYVFTCENYTQDETNNNTVIDGVDEICVICTSKSQMKDFMKIVSQLALEHLTTEMNSLKKQYHKKTDEITALENYVSSVMES